MPDPHRLLQLLAIAIAILLAGLHGFQTATLLSGELEPVVVQTDFRAFLGAADLLAAGRQNELYDLDAQFEVQHARFSAVERPDQTLVFANPPFVALPTLPLAQLDASNAYLLWFALTLLEVAGAIALTAALLGRRSLPTAALLAASSLPIAITLWQGQSSAILLAAWLGAWLATERDRPALGGAALALLAIKPQLLVLALVAVVAARRWRMLSGLVCAGSALFIAGSLTVGFAGWGEWLDLGKHLVDSGAAYGIKPRQMYTGRSLLQFVAGTDELASVQLPWLGLFLSCIGLAAWLAHRTRLRDRWGFDWALLVLLALLCSPHAYLHDTSLLLLPAVALLRATRSVPSLAPFAAIGIGAAWAMPYLVTAAGAPPPVLSVGSYLLMAAALAFGARRRSQ